MIKDSKCLICLQYLGDDGEARGEVGEYFGEEGLIRGEAG